LDWGRYAGSDKHDCVNFLGGLIW